MGCVNSTAAWHAYQLHATRVLPRPHPKAQLVPAQRLLPAPGCPWPPQSLQRPYVVWRFNSTVPGAAAWTIVRQPLYKPAGTTAFPYRLAARSAAEAWVGWVNVGRVDRRVGGAARHALRQLQGRARRQLPAAQRAGLRRAAAGTTAAPGPKCAGACQGSG